jgi:hypothetical protein
MSTSERVVRKWLADHQQTTDEFSEQVGWEIAALVDNPDALWDFNVHGLFDVCAGLECDWVAVLRSIE